MIKVDSNIYLEEFEQREVLLLYVWNTKKMEKEVETKMTITMVINKLVQFDVNILKTYSYYDFT